MFTIINSKKKQKSEENKRKKKYMKKVKTKRNMILNLLKYHKIKIISL